MKINMGIIGLGWMGTYHLRHITEDIGISVTAAYDIDSERVDFAKECGLKGYNKLESFLGDKDIDLVLIATPNNTHKNLVISSLKAGKNVICEKPVSLNSKDLEEMIDVSRQVGKLFTVHQNRRWDKDFLTVKKVVEDNTIGKPFFIESCVHSSNGIPGSWRCLKKYGGGMVYDWGVHLIDQVLCLVDSKVVSVYSNLFNIKYEEVDDNFFVNIKFENGVSALIDVMTCYFQPFPRWRVAGNLGTLVIDDFACNGSIIKGKIMELDWKPDINYDTMAEGPTRTMAPVSEETIDRIGLPSVESDSKDYFRNIKAVLTDKKELVVKPEELLRVMKVIDAIFISSEKDDCIKCSI